MNNNAPRSIADYLLKLRAALEGADPALVQDALYDAEEYLRAEVASHPGKSEADVLEIIASTYGAPEEVAAAYRETETRITAALRTPRAPPRPSALGRFFGIFADPRAYAGVLFMLFSLATGILYFTVTVTGLSLSAGLSILIIGVPFFLAFVGATRALALVECRLVEAVSGVRMPRRPLHPGAPVGFWKRLFAMLSDGRTWTTLAYNLLMLPLGIVYFTMAVVGLALGLSLIAGPIIEVLYALGAFGSDSVFAHGLHAHGDGGNVGLNPEWLATPWGLVLCGVAGILILTATLHVARGVTKSHAFLAKSMLVLP
jgi:uncharacterized membrane protein